MGNHKTQHKEPSRNGSVFTLWEVKKNDNLTMIRTIGNFHSPKHAQTKKENV